MKTIYKFLFVAVAAVLCTSCGNDESTSAQAEVNVEVADGGATIAADGGYTVITATNSNDVKAVADADWLTVSVDKNTITLTAPRNNSLETRNATVRIESEGLAPCTVNVMQMGTVLYLKNAPTSVITGDEGGEKSFGLVSTVAAEASSGVKWAKAIVKGDSLSISFDSNNDGRIREGYVYYSNGIKKDSLLIRQGDFKDVEGFYLLAGTDPNTGKDIVTLARIGSTADYPAAMTLNVGTDTAGQPQSYTIPVIFDPETLTLTLNNLSYLGTTEVNDSTRHLAVVLGNYSTGSTLYADVSADFKFTAMKLSGNDVTVAQLTDNGSWSDGKVNTISIMQFTSLPMTAENVVSTIPMSIALPTLIEYKLTGTSITDKTAEIRQAKELRTKLNVRLK